LNCPVDVLHEYTTLQRKAAVPAEIHSLLGILDADDGKGWIKSFSLQVIFDF
jgi:hypothetical protein